MSLRWGGKGGLMPDWKFRVSSLPMWRFDWGVRITLQLSRMDVRSKGRIIKKKFYCCSTTVVPIFHPPLSLTPTIPTSHTQSYPLLSLSMGPLYMFLDGPSPFFPVIPSQLPSGYCQFVLFSFFHFFNCCSTTVVPVFSHH